MNYFSKAKARLKLNHEPVNFMSSFQNGITHCPKCSKPLLSGGEFWGTAEFSMRCPWCQAAVLVSVCPKISASLKLSQEAVLADQPGVSHSLKQERAAEVRQEVLEESDSRVLANSGGK
jgi:hypothetical protein